MATNLGIWQGLMVGGKSGRASGYELVIWDEGGFFISFVFLQVA
jgi:hypothetical protein